MKLDTEGEAARRVVKAAYAKIRGLNFLGDTTQTDKAAERQDLRLLEAMLKASYAAQKAGMQEGRKSRKGSPEDYYWDVHVDEAQCVYSALACVIFGLDPDDIHPYCAAGVALQRVAAFAVFKDRSDEYYKYFDETLGQSRAIEDLRAMSTDPEGIMSALLK